MLKRICTLILAAMLLSVSALAESVLNVNGSGTVMVEADTASISLGVSMMGEDLAELQQQVNQTVENICARLEASDVPKNSISTNNLYINPRYDYSRGAETFVGYSISHNLTIVTESIDQVGMLIDLAFEAGANSFDSISFSVKDETQARNAALELAVQNALDKAEVIAKAAGKTIEGIVSIDESGNTYDYYDGAVAPAEAYGINQDKVGTSVRASQIAVKANVKITFAIQ